MGPNDTKAEEFIGALTRSAPQFGVDLGSGTVTALSVYYQKLTEWNARLHLVAPCSVDQFATRHVLESLTALAHIAEGASVIDVGSGGGLPILPCLIARSDITATLVESSPKKAIFLKETIRELGVGDRAQVINSRFETLDSPSADHLTCRALENFTQILPRLEQWACRIRTLLLFGGESLRNALESQDLDFDTQLLPESERRFLFVVRHTKDSLL
jgi:16S rRNA (guanine(527)-N(7))-methyltransferase RsmG